MHPLELKLAVGSCSRWSRRSAYRHGLRASELVDLRCEQVDYRTGTLAVR